MDGTVCGSVPAVCLQLARAHSALAAIWRDGKKYEAAVEAARRGADFAALAVEKSSPASSSFEVRTQTQRQLAKILVLAGKRQSADGELEKAARWAEEEWEKFPSTSNRLSLAKCFGDWAYNQVSLGNSDRAIELLEKTVELLESDKTLLSRTDAQNLLSRAREKITQLRQHGGGTK